MKRTIITVEVDPELKEHLDKQADKRKVTLSRYVRAALKKASGYKEKALL
jgi:predicted transcriptional regulator